MEVELQSSYSELSIDFEIIRIKDAADVPNVDFDWRTKVKSFWQPFIIDDDHGME